MVTSALPLVFKCINTSAGRRVAVTIARNRVKKYIKTEMTYEFTKYCFMLVTSFLFQKNTHFLKKYHF